jgi:hypothetical protein
VWSDDQHGVAAYYIGNSARQDPRRRSAESTAFLAPLNCAAHPPHSLFFLLLPSPTRSLHFTPLNYLLSPDEKHDSIIMTSSEWLSLLSFVLAPHVYILTCELGTLYPQSGEHRRSQRLRLASLPRFYWSAPCQVYLRTAGSTRTSS